MADDKILRPTIQEDAPFPGEAPIDVSQSSGSQQVFRPTETKEQEFPKRVIASELISSSIDSMSKKILGEYKFTSMGAIKIGQIKISDDGILGEDVDGRTTFALDPDTGDATFRGRILAGSVIATEIQGEYIVAGTITADKLNVTTLSAITADLGTVTAGSISVVNGANTIGLTPSGTNAIFAGTTGSPQFKVTPAGAVTASNLTITGGQIDIGGADATSFHMDSSGNIWLGGATFASCLWRVSNGGAMDTFTTASFGTANTYFDSGGALNTSADIVMNTGATLNWNGGDIGGLGMPAFGMNGSIDMNSNNITEIGQLSGFTITGTLNMNSQAITNCYTIGGANGTLSFKDAGRLEVNNHFDPSDGGSYNSGGSTRYWGDISYKTLTDRGCLGWFDEGVELQDGTIVSDTEALLKIKKHPTKQTIYGKPMLDYTSLPKVVYKPAADHNKNLFPRDSETNEPLPVKEKIVVGKQGGKVLKKEVVYYPQDGAETTALLSIMIGAIKELTTRVNTLEQR